MKRQIHKAIDVALTAAGIVIILFAMFVYSGDFLQEQMLWNGIGLLLLNAGVWGIAVKCMPTERRYSQLRDEGDRMISLIRELNSAALAHKQGLEDDSRFNSTLENMHDAVRLMAGLASLEDGEDLESKLAEQPQQARESDRDEQSVAKVA